MNRSAGQGRILFVTGTDTGVGKTYLTGLLLLHFRAQKIPALAMKPFCSGDRGDVDFLHRLQERKVARERINPFFFRRALAPWVAARGGEVGITRRAAVGRIRAMRRECEVLVVEGCGGLLAPLGEGYTLLELVNELGGETVVAARNRLGVLNHVLLTVGKLQEAGVQRISVALLPERNGDSSSRTNGWALREWFGGSGVEVVEFPGWSWEEGDGEERVRVGVRKLKKYLARLTGAA